MGSVECTTIFATLVDDLPAAWAFVMDRIDRVGPEPRITISPCHFRDEIDMGDDKPWVLQFEVSVSGMVQEPPTDTPTVEPTQ